MTKCNTKVRYWIEPRQQARLISLATYDSALRIIEDFTSLGWRAEIAPPHV